MMSVTPNNLDTSLANASLSLTLFSGVFAAMGVVEFAHEPAGDPTAFIGYFTIAWVALVGAVIVLVVRARFEYLADIARRDALISQSRSDGLTDLAQMTGVLAADLEPGRPHAF